MQANERTLLALDIGERRIGVASAKGGIGLAFPLTTLTVSENILGDIQKIIDSEQPMLVVVGMPRGLAGQTTEQTTYVEQFIAKLRSRLNVPVETIDEALTSVKAEAELQKRGKAYNKSDIDALAATYILEDFMSEHAKGIHAPK